MYVGGCVWVIIVPCGNTYNIEDRFAMRWCVCMCVGVIIVPCGNTCNIEDRFDVYVCVYVGGYVCVGTRCRYCNVHVKKFFY